MLVVNDQNKHAVPSPEQAYRLALIASIANHRFSTTRVWRKVADGDIADWRLRTRNHAVEEGQRMVGAVLLDDYLPAPNHE